MFLDLFGDRSARWPQTMHTGIMFADLSGIHSKPLIESRQPEKCSWTYPGMAPARWPQTMHTGIMFADLSRIHSRPLIESCQPEKYSWSYPELSGTVVGLGHRRGGD